MNATDVDTNISAVVANRLRSSSFERDMPSDVVVAFDSLVREGDAAVEAIAKTIMQAMDRASHDGEHRFPTSWAIRDLMTILGRIDSPRSRSELVGFLTKALPEDQPDQEYHRKAWGTAMYVPYYNFIHGNAIDALGECKGGEDPDVLSGLLLAATQRLAETGQWVHWSNRHLPRMYFLARRFGGRIPLSPAQVVGMTSDLSGPEELLGIIDDFKDEIPAWPTGVQCSFWWFYGHQVENAQGKPEALPCYAASLLANPGKDAAAWSKFPGVSRSASEARTLARKHPLPERFRPTSRRKWWHFGQ